MIIKIVLATGCRIVGFRFTLFSIVCIISVVCFFGVVCANVWQQMFAFQLRFSTSCSNNHSPCPHDSVFAETLTSPRRSRNRMYISRPVGQRICITHYRNNKFYIPHSLTFNDSAAIPSLVFVDASRNNNERWLVLLLMVRVNTRQ